MMIIGQRVVPVPFSWLRCWHTQCGVGLRRIPVGGKRTPGLPRIRSWNRGPTQSTTWHECATRFPVGHAPTLTRQHDAAFELLRPVFWVAAPTVEHTRSSIPPQRTRQGRNGTCSSAPSQEMLWCVALSNQGPSLRSPIFDFWCILSASTPTFFQQLPSQPRPQRSRSVDRGWRRQTLRESPRIFWRRCAAASYPQVLRHLKQSVREETSSDWDLKLFCHVCDDDQSVVNMQISTLPTLP